jgi:hypothetical protein
MSHEPEALDLALQAGDPVPLDFGLELVIL